MPEVTPEIPVAEDLDQRVESLLQQMESAAEQAAGIAAEIDARTGAVADATLPPAAEADLATQVDQLLAEAAKTSGDQPSREGPQSIGSLDDELAKIASDLMEGDFSGDAAIPSAPAPVAREAPVAPPAEPSIGAPSPAVEVPVSAPAAASPGAPAGPSRPPIWRRAVAAIALVVTALSHAVRRHAPSLLALLEPIAFRIAALVSAPLRNRPALVRDAVGWVAVGTMFWASCLFAYFLFLYEPDAPKPSSAAVGLMDPSHPEAEPEREPAKAEHKEEAAAEHGEGGHGEEGHGDAKKKDPPKPALKRGDKDALNRPAEKPAKKEGGGHEE